MEMCLGISIVNFAYSYDHQIRFLHISGTHWPTTPIVSHTQKKTLGPISVRQTFAINIFVGSNSKSCAFPLQNPQFFSPFDHRHIFFFHVSSTVNGFVAVVWKRSFILLKICSMPQYSSFFVREDEKTVNSQTMHNSKVLAMDVGYGNSFFLSSSSSGLDHKTAHPSNFFFLFYLFYRWTSTCCGPIFNIHQYHNGFLFL